MAIIISDKMAFNIKSTKMAKISHCVMRPNMMT